MNVAFLRFRAGLRAQGKSLDGLPCVGPLQPYASYIGLFVLGLGLLTNGWTAFVDEFDIQVFVTGYLGIRMFFSLFGFYKFWEKTRFQKAADMNLTFGLDRIADYERSHGYDRPVILTSRRKVLDYFY